MAYILIIVISQSHNRGLSNSIASVEFKNKTNCELAAKEYDQIPGFSAICFKK